MFPKTRVLKPYPKCNTAKVTEPLRNEALLLGVCFGEGCRTLILSHLNTTLKWVAIPWVLQDILSLEAQGNKASKTVSPDNLLQLCWLTSEGENRSHDSASCYTVLFTHSVVFPRRFSSVLVLRVTSRHYFLAWSQQSEAGLWILCPQALRPRETQHVSLWATWGLTADCL